MKSNICYISSQECTLEIVKRNQLEKIKLISTTTRLSKLDLKKKSLKRKAQKTKT